VHGGYAATLLDSAMGLAVHSMLPAGSGYTTLEFKVSFIRGMTLDTGAVRTEGGCSMSEGAPPPRKRASPIRRIACLRTRPPHA
jgi:hypothetical protein